MVKLWAVATGMDFMEMEFELFLRELITDQSNAHHFTQSSYHLLVSE